MKPPHDFGVENTGSAMLPPEPGAYLHEDEKSPPAPGGLQLGFAVDANAVEKYDPRLPAMQMASEVFLQTRKLDTISNVAKEFVPLGDNAWFLKEQERKLKLLPVDPKLDAKLSKLRAKNYWRLLYIYGSLAAVLVYLAVVVSPVIAFFGIFVFIACAIHGASISDDRADGRSKEWAWVQCPFKNAIKNRSVPLDVLVFATKIQERLKHGGDIELKLVYLSRLNSEARAYTDEYDNGGFLILDGRKGISPARVCYASW